MAVLFRIIATLAAFFASTFLLVRFTGLFNMEKAVLWLEKAQSINPTYLFILVMFLLFIDLFVAVPTLTITILSGYFLGFAYGGLAAVSGMLLAGFSGYFLSRRFGPSILGKIVKSESKRNEAVASFNQYGPVMILLSRASPILPEVSACMAGMTGMKFNKFFPLWCLNCIPFALIASYAGSISDFNNPKPAIYTAIAIYALLWLGWMAFRTYKNSIP
jgi:uncharacterized membrane protein YdjX (TVP38/TMEM64 family)